MQVNNTFRRKKSTESDCVWIIEKVKEILFLKKRKKEKRRIWEKFPVYFAGLKWASVLLYVKNKPKWRFNKEKVGSDIRKKKSEYNAIEVFIGRCCEVIVVKDLRIGLVSKIILWSISDVQLSDL